MASVTARLQVNVEDIQREITRITRRMADSLRSLVRPVCGRADPATLKVSLWRRRRFCTRAANHRGDHDDFQVGRRWHSWTFPQGGPIYATGGIVPGPPQPVPPLPYEPILTRAEADRRAYEALRRINHEQGQI